jgi:hypothetical protein
MTDGKIFAGSFVNAQQENFFKVRFFSNTLNTLKYLKALTNKSQAEHC